MMLDELSKVNYYTIYHKESKELPFGDRTFTSVGALKNAFNHKSNYLLGRGRFDEQVGFDTQDIYKITELSVVVI